MTAAEHEVLEWQQYRLDAQQHRMHKADGVDCVKYKAPEEADIFRCEQLVVACVCVGDAAVSGRDAIEAAIV